MRGFSAPDDRGRTHPQRPFLTMLAFALLAASTLVTIPGPASALTIGYTTNWGVRGLGDADFALRWTVRDLDHSGNRLFVAGRFTEVVAPDGSTRDQRSLAAFDRRTGVWDANFRPVIDGVVHTIEASPDRSRLYLGGEFSTVNGIETGPIAAIDTNTGAVIPSFSVDLGASGRGRTIVLDIAVSGSIVYIGGDFGSVNGTTRSSLARVTSSGRLDTAFSPRVTGGPIMTIEPSRDGRVFVGGQFKVVDADANHAFFVGLSSAGRLLDQEKFDQRQLAETPLVFDILETDDFVYIASQSNLLTVVDQRTLAKERTFGPDLANAGTFGWFRSSDFQALAQVGDSVFAANHTRWEGQPSSGGNGHLDSGTGRRIASNLVAKFDRFSNQVEDYLPGDMVGGVWALHDAGDGCVWAGGNFQVERRVDWNLTRICESAGYGPFGSNRSFVRQQYLDFLGRGADSDGLDYWATQAGSSTTNAAPIIEAFLLSPEFSLRRQIIRLYLGLFGRLPDNAGLDYWSGQRQAGVSLEEITNGFLFSPEFANLVGIVDDRSFAAQVYRSVLGREPDQAGLDFWHDELLSGMPRTTLVVAFTESPEFVARTDATVTVTTIYSGMLNRGPDQGGLAYWVGELNRGAPVVPLINGFFYSAEYENRIARLPTAQP